MGNKDFIVGIFVVLSAFLVAFTIISFISFFHKKKGIMSSLFLLILSVTCVLFSAYLITMPENENIAEIDPEQLSVTFDEIYLEYESNELRADEKYKNNRYTITATVNGMETDGLLNWSGGATLTMETKVDGTIVFFYASFEKEQEEALKSINVGDEITFEGECLSAGSWVNCELID